MDPAAVFMPGNPENQFLLLQRDDVQSVSVRFTKVKFGVLGLPFFRSFCQSVPIFNVNINQWTAYLAKRYSN